MSKGGLLLGVNFFILSRCDMGPMYNPKYYINSNSLDMKAIEKEKKRNKKYRRKNR